MNNTTLAPAAGVPGGLLAGVAKAPSINNATSERAENGWILFLQFGGRKVAKTWNEAIDILADHFNIEGHDSSRSQADAAPETKTWREAKRSDGVYRE
jgi:hypothetical protein